MFQKRTTFSVANGFSLMELMVAISLLGLVVTTVYQAFFQASNVSLKIKEQLGVQEELRLLMKLVLDDLQGVQYLENYVRFAKFTQNAGDIPRQSGIIAKQEAGPEAGDFTKIHFHTAVPSRFFPETRAQQNDPQLHEVSYWLEPPTDPTEAWKLMRREDFYIDGDMTTGGRQHILSENISFFQIEFLEQNTSTSLLQRRRAPLEKWIKGWDSKEAECSIRQNEPKAKKYQCLPLALRLTMGIADQNGDLIHDTMELNLNVSTQQ